MLCEGDNIVVLCEVDNIIVLCEGDNIVVLEFPVHSKEQLPRFHCSVVLE